MSPSKYRVLLTTTIRTTLRVSDLLKSHASLEWPVPLAWPGERLPYLFAGSMPVHTRSYNGPRHRPPTYLRTPFRNGRYEKVHRLHNPRRKARMIRLARGMYLYEYHGAV